MTPYPRHDINPNQKGEKWLLQYAKAVWSDSGTSMPQTMFYRNAKKYDSIASYVNGTQSINQYKKFLTGDAEADESWMKIDWSIRPIVATKRDIVVGKIHQRKTNIICSPIDPLARDEADKYFADIRTKILMRQALMQVNPELAMSPELMPQPGEPEDLEELEMHMDYGYKHNAAMEAEQAIDLVHYQNNYNQSRKEVIQSLFDYGVAGYKDFIDDEGRVGVRAVNIRNLVTNYCRKENFSDLVHVGEVIEVSLADLAGVFPAEDLKKIAEKATNKSAVSVSNGMYNKDTDRFKVKVLDLELISYNSMVYRQRENEEGNLVYKKSSYENKFSNERVHIKGEMKPKFVSRDVKVVYKVKWIIDTDYVYDYGLATNMKRDNSRKYDTCLSYHLYAYNMNEMRAQGYMERLIPIVDEYQNTIFKIQNFKQRWLPYIIDIDLTALENVALGAGGQKMTPLELLDMLHQTNILVGRKMDVAGNPNYKSVDIRPTGMAEEFITLVNDLGRILNDMNMVIGLNELTDSTTPNSKTLVPVANMAYESTNNALYPIIQADKALSESVAKGIIQRVQIAVKNGKVEGYIHALGSNSIKFIKVSPDIALHEFGIKVVDQPTDEDRAVLMQQLNLKDANGLIDPQDYFMVKNCTNLKQAEMLLAFRVKKRKEAEQQKALELQRQNGEIQVQSAQAAEQAKQQTIILEYQLKDKLIDKEKAWDYKIKAMELEARDHETSKQMLGSAMESQNSEQLPVDEGM